jgi:hypothetical protein
MSSLEEGYIMPYNRPDLRISIRHWPRHGFTEDLRCVAICPSGELGWGLGLIGFLGLEPSHSISSAKGVCDLEISNFG